MFHRECRGRSRARAAWCEPRRARDAPPARGQPGCCGTPVSADYPAAWYGDVRMGPAPYIHERCVVRAESHPAMSGRFRCFLTPPRTGLLRYRQLRQKARCPQLDALWSAATPPIWTLPAARRTHAAAQWMHAATRESWWTRSWSSYPANWQGCFDHGPPQTHRWKYGNISPASSQLGETRMMPSAPSNRAPRVSAAGGA